MRDYTLNQDERDRYGAIYLLQRMIQDPFTVSVLYEGESQYLERPIQWLYARDWVDLRDDHTTFVPNIAGRDHLQKFEERYRDFLRMFDMYFVNLDTGEFPFAQYYEMEPDEFHEYLHRERANEPGEPLFTDLRLAVADYKGLDPREIVFMSFLNEGRFDGDENGFGWQFNLTSGEIWDEMMAICDSALYVERLGYPLQGGGEVSGEDVITDVIDKGSKIMMELIKQGDAIAEQEAQEAAAAAEQERQELARHKTTTQQYEVVEVKEVKSVRYVPMVEPVFHPPVFYDNYLYDPFYVSPIWHDPW